MSRIDPSSATVVVASICLVTAALAPATAAVGEVDGATAAVGEAGGATAEVWETDAAPAPKPAVTGDVAASQDSPVVTLDRVVDQRGPPADEVFVTFRYDLPDNFLALTVVDVPEAGDENATVVSTDGFESEESGNWSWDESTAGPTITVRYDLPTDRFTRDDRGTAGADWAFLNVPAPSHEGTYSGDTPSDRPTFSYETSVRGEGAATDAYAYLGPHDRYSRDASNQTVTLYVPESTGLETEPEVLLGYLVDASERLTVRARDDEVHAFAVPSTDRTIAPVGATRGENSLYVDADAGVGGDETWVHEYVHTRQAFRPDPDASWLVEGSASYYGIVLRAHAGEWSEQRLYDRIGGDQPGTLAQPTTWERLTPYVEGRTFLAHLNLRLREATDGQVTITRVIRDLNTGDPEVTHEDVVDAVRRYDADTADWADRTLRSDESLSTPRDPAAYVFAGSEPDGDGLNLSAERDLGSSPFATDTDGDDLPDDREAGLGTDPTRADSDGDGLADPRELENSTDPTNPDTDEDGVPDGRDQCPTEAGDGEDGCPATDTAVLATFTAGDESTDAAGPLGVAPVVAVLVVALLARTRARRQ